MHVSVLRHERDLGDDASDVKLIGVYPTRADALGAQDRLGAAPGFGDHRDGFSVDAYALGQDHGTDGFISAGHTKTAAA